MIDTLHAETRTAQQLLNGPILLPLHLKLHAIDREDAGWMYLVVIDTEKKEVVWYDPLDCQYMTDNLYLFAEKMAHALNWMYMHGKVHMKREIKRKLPELLQAEINGE